MGGAGEDGAGAAGSEEVASAMAGAAAEWLDTLDDTQAGVARWAAPSGDDAEDAERRRWFYTPTDHGGLTFHQQRPAQHQAVMRLLATGLSPAGYAAVAAVMGLENELDRREGFGCRPHRERFRDPGLYHLRVFGEPGDGRTWGWRFGGHHVSVNVLVAHGRVAATTPCFLGANPAATPLLGGGTHRPLGPAEDLAREIVRGLDPDLAGLAVLDEQAPLDVVGANRAVVAPGDRPLPSTAVRREGPGARAAPPTGHDAVALSAQPRGVPASALDDVGRARLRSVLSAYLGRVPDAVSPLRRYDDDAALDAVHLAWAGSTEPGEPHYYRLQGPRLLLEWDNAGPGADHAHSVWRDPESDLGLDVLAAHHVAFAHR